MILHKIQQNSDEWDKIRLGKFTASSCDKLLSGENTKGYTELIEKIAEERFTGEKCQSKVWIGNSFTERGHMLEPIAIQQYENESFNVVESIGFVEKDSWCGCSPDGLIGDNKLIQVKCPIFRTQMEYHEKLKVPTNYYKQMQFELYTTKRESNIFYSYHPKLSAVEIEVFVDEIMQKEIDNRMKIAIEQVEYKIEIIKKFI